MKKLAVTLSLAALATTGAWAQGFVNIGNATILVKTNAVGIGGGSGNTTTAASGFFYDVLTAASTVTTVDANLQNLLTSAWSDAGVTAVNGTGALGAGKMTGAATAATGWDTGVFQSAIVVGWSAGLGTTWAQVKAQLAGATFSGGVWGGSNMLTPGFLGVSTIALANPGSSSGSAAALFGSTSNAQVPTIISTSPILYAVSVPEPATLALIGLGAASLMIFRRRK